MNNQLLSPLLISLQVTCFAGVIAVCLGTLLAFLMNRYKFKGQFIVEVIFLLPIVLPPSVIGFLLLLGVGSNSPLFPIINLILGHSIIFTKSAAIIASAIVAFPIMYQAAKVAFRNIDNSIVEAARLDRASEVEIIQHIIYPVSKYALASGAVLAFARAFGEFGATLMVAGNIPGKTQTLPVAIYMAMSVNDSKLAMIYVLIMILISTTFLLLTKKLGSVQ